VVCETCTLANHPGPPVGLGACGFDSRATLAPYRVNRCELVTVCNWADSSCSWTALPLTLPSASRKRTLRGGSQTSGRTPANESGGLLAGVSRLELMSNSKNKDDVFGREPTMLRDTTVAAARENEFPSTFLGCPPQ